MEGLSQSFIGGISLSTRIILIDCIEGGVDLVWLFLGESYQLKAMSGH